MEVREIKGNVWFLFFLFYFQSLIFFLNGTSKWKRNKRKRSFSFFFFKKIKKFTTKEAKETFKLRRKDFVHKDQFSFFLSPFFFFFFFFSPVKISPFCLLYSEAEIESDSHFPYLDNGKFLHNKTENVFDFVLPSFLSIIYIYLLIYSSILFLQAFYFALFVSKLCHILVPFCNILTYTMLSISTYFSLFFSSF